MPEEDFFQQQEFNPLLKIKEKYLDHHHTGLDSPRINFKNLEPIVNLALAQGDIFFINNKNQITKLAAGTSGQYLQTKGVADPVWLSISPARGQNSRTTGTGNQAITGVGFQPSMVVIQAVGPGGGTGNVAGSLGSATSSSARSCSFWSKADTGQSSQQSASFVITITNQLGTVQDQADFVSMDTDGFTINWTTKSANQIFFEYQCFR